MQSFPDMAQAHEWTLRRLREMAGRLTEQAYLRASEAQAPDGGYDEEAAQRWMLVFDRMARGLRLSIALEARLARERRWDAEAALRAAQGERHAPRWRAPAAPRAPRESDPYESDRERDDDGLASDAPLAQRIARLKSIVEGAGVEAPKPRFVFVEPTAPHGAPPMDAPRPESAHSPAPPWRGSG